MWVELRNTKRNQCEMVNTNQVARCLKSTDNCIKLIFPDGSETRYECTYTQWKEYTGKKSNAPNNTKHAGTSTQHGARTRTR